MATVSSQAIAGVSPKTEATVISVYPSISSKAPGRIIGQICNCIPTRICGVPISCILFALPLGLFSVLGYAILKAIGVQYEVTNKSVKIWQMTLGAKSRLNKEVALDDIYDVAIEVVPGQEFFYSGDIYLLKEDGSSLMHLEGVLRPEVLRQNILKTRDAKKLTAESLSMIEARG